MWGFEAMPCQAERRREMPRDGGRTHGTWTAETNAQSLTGTTQFLTGTAQFLTGTTELSFWFFFFVCFLSLRSFRKRGPFHPHEFGLKPLFFFILRGFFCV